MRYAGWYPRRRGILEHLDRGTISLLDLAVHDFLCLICDHETGVAYASSEKIRALCPVEINDRAIRRALAKMERIGWIKRFCVRGRRGNYPILIAKYFVREASGEWKSVNAEKTTDLNNIQFDAVHDAAFLTLRADRRAGSELVREVSGIQEVRSENEKQDSHDGASLRCASSFSDPFTYAGLNREKLTMSKGFEQRFSELFKEYPEQWSHLDNGECTCSPADFLDIAMDEFKSQKIRWPRALLARKKELEKCVS